MCYNVSRYSGLKPYHILESYRSGHNGHDSRSAACGGRSEGVVAQRSEKSSTNGYADFSGHRKRARKKFFHQIKYSESYRSGHNEAVLKTVWAHAHVGSNPTLSATEKEPHTLGFFFIVDLSGDSNGRGSEWMSGARFPKRRRGRMKRGKRDVAVKKIKHQRMRRFFWEPQAYLSEPSPACSAEQVESPSLRQKTTDSDRNLSFSTKCAFRRVKFAPQVKLSCGQ